MLGSLTLAISVTCLTPAVVLLPPPERLLISVEDEALGKAIVRSANQHLAGSVELLPKRAPVPPRGLQLTVYADGPDGLMLVLSRNRKLRVVRVLKLSGRHGPFDMAEAVAIAITDMRGDLDEQTQRTLTPAPLSQGMLSRTAYPVQVPEMTLRQRHEPLPPAEPPEPPPAPLLEPEPPEPEPAPLFAHLLPRRDLQPRLPLAGSPIPRWKWQLGIGLPLGVLSLAIGGLGVTSLTLDGTCVDSVCNYRYDGRIAGIVELSLGSAAAVASAGLLGSIRMGADRQRSGRLTPIVVPTASTRGVGLSLHLGF